MKFVTTDCFSIPALRTIASQKPIVERPKFYSENAERIKCEFSNLPMFEVSRLIFKETDSYLQEIECMVLADKLCNYIGPMTVEFLDSVIEIFSIEAIWLLATNAQMDLIREKAKMKLDNVLEQYGDVYPESQKSKRKKRGDSNEKHKRR